MEHEDLMLYLLRGGNTKEDSRVVDMMKWICKANSIVLSSQKSRMVRKNMIE